MRYVELPSSEEQNISANLNKSTSTKSTKYSQKHSPEKLE